MSTPRDDFRFTRFPLAGHRVGAWPAYRRTTRRRCSTRPSIVTLAILPATLLMIVLGGAWPSPRAASQGPPYAIDAAPPDAQSSDAPHRRERLDGRPLGCGPSALASVAYAFSEPRGRSILTTMRRDGLAHQPVCSLADLHVHAERAGLRTVGLRIPPTLLAELPLPAIVHLADGHFVTLWAVDDRTVVIGDGEKARQSLSRGGFARRFSGNVLVVAQ